MASYALQPRVAQKKPPGPISTLSLDDSTLRWLRSWLQNMFHQDGVKRGIFVVDVLNIEYQKRNASTC